MLLNLKDSIIPKEVNNVDKQREVEGIIKAQLKYVRRVQRVNLIVKYKATTAPINVFTNARDANFTTAINTAL